MKISKKQVLIATALILMLTVTTFMANIKPVNAITTEWDTFCFVMVSPNPVGVDQNVLVSFQLDKVNPLSTIRGNLFEGFKVTITKPDNTTETKGPYQAYSTGGAYFYYTPTMIGNYTFQASFPGQWVNGSYTSISTSFGNWQNQTGRPLIEEQRYYKPSTSGLAYLTVKQDPVVPPSDIPLPTDYWQRPISGENKGWGQIADNWLMLSYDITSRTFSATTFAPYTSAPKSPHILWKQPVTFGGVVGGPFGDRTYYTGLSYEQFYLPMIINGRIIYVDHGPTGNAAFGTRCISLYTGEDIWYLNNTNIAFAQVLEFDSGNEHGALAYLWSTSGSTWLMYDAFSGRHILTVANVTSGTTTFGPNGELLSYSFAGTGVNRRLIMWNSTLAIVGLVSDYWSPQYMGTIDGRRGIQWNVSVPEVAGDPAIQAINEGYLLASTVDQTAWPIVYVDVAYDLNAIKRDSAGNYPTSINHLWTFNRTNINSHRPTLSRNIENGVYARWDQAATQVHGYDIKTGAEKWITDPLPMGWGLFSGGLHLAYGKAFMATYDGHLRAYDTTDGHLVWDYYTGSAGFENAYGTWPAYGYTVADGMVFLTNDEHSPDAIPWRGGKLTAIDAETGAKVWSLDGRLRHTTIADGIITAFNLYDNQIYTIGKGPSKTTVTTSQNPVAKGSSTMILGTVTDQTPSTKDTPAISDEDMDRWMAYLHMNKPKPTDATGVNVTLVAIDPNGNEQIIGDVTSDANGNFGIMWTPQLEGQYRIVAKFAGTNSYGSSEASTYLGVGAASTSQPTSTPTTSPTASPQPTQTPVSPQAPFFTTEVMLALAAVIIIIVVAAAVILFRRK